MIARIAAPVFLMFVLATIAASGAVRNVLIGKWTLVAGDCPATDLEYTPSTGRELTKAIGPYPAAWGARAVTYNITPQTIWVIPTQNAFTTGMHIYGQPVKIIDADHILPDSPGRCTYARAR